MNNLSMDGEFRYIVSWFNEWSELQREDFVPVMVQYLAQEVVGEIYMNGVVHAVAQADISNKPMSLFQCRIKLFREWAPKWPLEFKHKLKEKIMEIDTKVGERIMNEIEGQIHTNGNDNVHSNGNTNGLENGAALTEADDEVNATVAERSLTAAAIVAGEIRTNAVDVGNSLSVLPNNETSVDIEADTDEAENGAAATVAVVVSVPVAVAANDALVEPADQVDEMLISVANNGNNADVPLLA